MLKILLLVASETNLPIILAAKKAGCYVITCDNNKNNPGHKLADENLFIDVYDYKSIINKIKCQKIDAVFSFVSAHGLESSALISDYFNLNGYTFSSLKILTEKELFRDFLVKNGIDCPSYQCVVNLLDLYPFEIIYPAIVKPTDSGGSQGVKRVNNWEELEEFFPVSKSFSKSGKVIIEEYIESSGLINGDCLIHDGEIIASIIGDYIYDRTVNDVLPIATVFPSKHNTKKALVQLTQITKYLSIPNGIINFEAIIKNDKTYIIEINPRPSGNYIWKLMGYQYGLDIPTFLLTESFHNNKSQIINLKANERSYAYQLIYTDKWKTYEGINFPAKLETVLKDLLFFKNPGDKVNPFSNLFDRVGIALLEFKNENQKKYYLENLQLFKI